MLRVEYFVEFIAKIKKTRSAPSPYLIDVQDEDGSAYSYN